MHAVILRVAVFFLLYALVGCAPKYSCPRSQDGTVCKDPIEVYNLTENQDHVVGSSSNADRKDAKKEEVNPAHLPGIHDEKLFTPQDAPMPILEPAKVLRIWIAPWIDNKQDLHWPSMIFTEVTPRRWSIGGPGFEQVQALVPLQVIKPKSNKQEGDKQDDDIMRLFKAEQSGQMQQPSNTQKVQTIRIPDRSH